MERSRTRGGRRNPGEASYFLPSAMICSMCTGGGSLLNGRCRGSMKLTPSGGENHIFPSGDLATNRLWLPARARILTPSELSKTVVWTRRFESLTHAFNSERLIRTRPQAMYNQKE